MKKKKVRKLSKEETQMIGELQGWLKKWAKSKVGPVRTYIALMTLSNAVTMGIQKQGVDIPAMLPPIQEKPLARKDNYIG